MPASYEFGCLEGLSKQSWLVKGEHDRFRSICMKWKKQNPNAPIEKEMLLEGLVRCHLWEQRLVDRRVFFNGEPTDYRVIEGRKQVDLSSEDQTRKDKEFIAYMPMVQRWKIDCLKLALANSIDVQVVNDLGSLFSAIDSEDKQRLSLLTRSNGEKKTATI